MSPSRTADQYSFILKGLAGAAQEQLRLALPQFCRPQQGTQRISGTGDEFCVLRFVASLENLAILICGTPRNSGTGANFAAFAKFVACSRITPRINPRNSATGANLPIFIWAGEVYLMEDCPRIALAEPPRSRNWGRASNCGSFAPLPQKGGQSLPLAPILPGVAHGSAPSSTATGRKRRHPRPPRRCRHPSGRGSRSISLQDVHLEPAARCSAGA